MHEDVCPECRGRFLDGDTTVRLFSERLGISREIILELAREGPRRLTCPGCSRRMTLTLTRSVQVDLCGGCGGAWLDDGELTTLTGGTLVEVRHPASPAPPLPPPKSLLDEARAAFGPGPVPATAPGPVEYGSGLELAREPQQTRSKPTVDLVPDHAPELPVTFAPRRVVGAFEVCCIKCDQALDLGQTNWLINQRPWCPGCATPHTGFAGVAGGLATAALSMLGGRRLAWRSPSFAEALFDFTDAIRVPPENAEVFFGPFFRPVASR